MKQKRIWKQCSFNPFLSSIFGNVCLELLPKTEHNTCLSCFNHFFYKCLSNVYHHNISEKCLSCFIIWQCLLWFLSRTQVLLIIIKTSYSLYCTWYVCFYIHVSNDLCQQTRLKTIHVDSFTLSNEMNFIFTFILVYYLSVAEPKLFIFGSGSTCVPYFGSSSCSCHILPLVKLYYIYYRYNSSTIRNMSQWRFFFILASSKLTLNIF